MVRPVYPRQPRSRWLPWLTLLLAAPLVVPVASAQLNPPRPRWIKGSFVGSSFVLSFIPGTSNWIAIEESIDSVNWQEVVSLAASTTASAYADVEARLRPHRVFRLRSPGTSSGVAAARWANRAQRAYRFHLDRISSLPPFLIQAEMEIRPNAKQITEAIADGLPVAEPLPDHFPSIEELFSRLDQARTEGAPQVWASYDVPSGFPSRYTFDLRGVPNASIDAGALVQYRITNLVLLPD